MKYMSVNKAVFHYKCNECNYVIKKEELKRLICPVCNPQIIVEELRKICKEMKEEQDGKNSSNKT